MKTIRLTMAQALVKFLENQYISVDGETRRYVKGVIGIFGHGNVTGLGEALESSQQLTFYQGNSEQGMAHVAIAYAKQKKRQEIFAVTSSIGPGAMNMVTAAATATVNRIPVLLLPGDIFASRQPDPVLQQLEDPTDLTISANDAFRPVSRYWDRIARPEQIMTAAMNAMRVLTNPADTGAVTLCLPQDVQSEAYDYPESFFQQRIHYMDRLTPKEAAVDRAVSLIRSKKTPMIICGGGVRYSEAADALLSFAEAFHIPFAETQAGKGTLPWDHSLNLGGMGVTGTQAANRLAKEADLIIAVGTRLGDFTTASKWAFKNADIPIIGINVLEFDAWKMDALPLVGDARETLKALQQVLESIEYKTDFGGRILEEQTAWQEEVSRLYETDWDEGLSQTRVLGELNDCLLDQNAVVVGASGSLPGCLQRLWKTKEPNGYHMEYGFSCMGYEVSGALGVKMAEPDREVYAMVGDGSFVMLHSEILTSLQEGIKINVLLFDNSGYQCILNLQRSKGIHDFANEFRYRASDTGKLDGNYIPVDFAAIGEGYGMKTYRVTTIDELRVAVEDSKKQSISTLIDIKVLPGSMTGSYDSWWRVGVPEVSDKADVLKAGSEMEAFVQKARPY
ncbi:MAG: 3D-(3,5/4)-trihydroxycyclohexane-1,2-dione acylhydrolase (decyclizing) [Bacillota bacterium]|nr:3D-(3,5/4)-trihydroxycyclohexane-1,2-dione acylhydrolase (decyclizing) [Bacillota bacterium]MDW7677251.1 3D-(3,5/4)-trihydroxycyclohexane-1,2-dione acylhydrolase (decyclizing) [Bacillota bacterium]